jgi:hypothetical protein
MLGSNLFVKLLRNKYSKKKKEREREKYMELRGGNSCNGHSLLYREAL